MTKNQFDILTYLEKVQIPQTQRLLSIALQKAIGGINKTIGELLALGYMADGSITEAGLQALEPYRVKRAVFMAAGFGSRLIPLTLSTPKPLLRVKGVRIIDSILDAIIAVGITEIYIVRGYLAEQFDQLLVKYPSITFLENPRYCDTNNISSAMVARAYMHNAYVMDADLLLMNPDLIGKYQYATNYVGAYTEKTDDWCLIVKNRYAQKMKLGGMNCYFMYTFSFWTEEDGIRLAKHIETVYESPGGKECYWDQVALDCFPKEFRIAVRDCSFADLIEIDTYQDLVCIDPAYGEGGIRMMWKS